MRVVAFSMANSRLGRSLEQPWGVHMGRGRRGLFDNLAAMPWPVGVIVGVVGYLVIAYGVPAWFVHQESVFAQAFAQKTDLFSIPAAIFSALCLLASLMSYLGVRRKRRMLDKCTGLESIAALGWRDFERLAGEAFRRQGYVVEEAGLGGADGGIDLILRRDGRRILVQCKQWRRKRVRVNEVREMYGLLAHHGADEVRIAALGDFTQDAKKFAEGKPIELIDGSALLKMIRAVQTEGDVASLSRSGVEPVIEGKGSSVSPVPGCPRCGKPMVQRMNRKSGSMFWGCATFPECRGTRQ